MYPSRSLRPGGWRRNPGAKWLGLCVLLTVGVLLFSAVPSGATTVLQLGTAQLIEKADTVLRGKVTAVEARNHSEHQFIYTYVTVEVDEVLKGDAALAGQQVVLEELGGQVGKLITQVPGTPTYQVGEEVLSFLENHPGGYLRTYGMVQGKFLFERDARNGALLLTRPADWNEAMLAPMQEVTDLTAARADGNYMAEPLLQALRDWTAAR